MFSTSTIAGIIKTGKSNAIGALGENIVYNALRFYGIACHITNVYHHGDIVTKSVKIEVKTATIGKDNRYRFCLRKSDKYGVTDYRNSDYVLLQTIDDSLLISYHLIPSSEITVKHITLGQTSKKYAKYKTTLENIVKAIS